MRRFVLDFERPVVELEMRLQELKESPSSIHPEIAAEIVELDSQITRLRTRIYSNLTAWQKVQLARHPDRPRTLDYVEAIFTDFVELHGDRLFRDDPAIVAGFAQLEGAKVVIVGHQKGRNTKENVARNFGMAHPEGYRKALRIMRLAEKFGLPLVSFIDTPGAYPGIEAEERGQALAIAQNLMEMNQLATPIVAVNIGEGGSGGALALGVADRVLMLENAYYSVITPEGCASILWRDDSKADEAAEALGLTAGRLLELGLIDQVIKEPLGGAHYAPALVGRDLKRALLRNISELVAIPIGELLQKRYAKLRGIGRFEEAD